MNTPDASKTCAERRREARRLQDPHHSHPFRRFYIGPTPVSSTVAANVAQAIAEDIKIEKPRAIGVPGRDGRVVSGKPSVEYLTEKASRDQFGSRIHRARSADGIGTSQNGIATPGKKSKKNKTLPPLKIPQRNRLPSFRREISRDGSFMSARSMPESVLSEGDLPINQSTGTVKIRRLPRRETDTIVDLGHNDLPLTPIRRLDRKESQSVQDTPRNLGRKKLSFDMGSPKDRRGRSEGTYSAVPGGSILQKEHLSVTQETDSTLRRLLDVPTHDDSFSNDATPTRSQLRQMQQTLRNTRSHRSLGQSSIIMHPVDEDRVLDDPLWTSSPAREGAMKYSDPPFSATMTDADTSVNFDTSRATALKNLKGKARKRYTQKRDGPGNIFPRSSTMQSRLGHNRDVSRQSKVSRASEAGTFASVGTRFSEGSFGATGGFRAKLAMKLNPMANKSMEARARNIKLERQKRGGHGSAASSSGGVIPGAVGTSAGGTKWVGQTYEIGKRFWQVIETREEELEEQEDELEAEERVLEEANYPRDGKSGSDAKENEPSRQASESKSPDDVLATFAKKAQEQDMDHEKDKKSRLDEIQARSLVHFPSEIRKAKHDRHTEVEENSQIDRLPGSLDTSFASPQEIENRQGWNDVVSFMSKRQKASHRDRTSPKEQEIKDMNGHATHLEMQNSQEEASTSDDLEEVFEEPEPIEELSRMTVRDALSVPEAPLGVEDRFPNATFELLRRNSNPGVSPRDELNDAASDHLVAAKPVSSIPIIKEPLAADSSARNGILGRKRTISSNSWDDRGKISSPADSSAPLLKRSGSASDLLLHHFKGSRDGIMNSILQDPDSDPTLLKKTVQFQRGSNSTTLAAPLNTRYGPTLFPTRSGASSPALNGRALVGGRLKSAVQGDAAPAPPEEVLSRSATPDGITPSPQGYSPGGEKMTSCESMVTRRAILKRDRMLVKLAWTPSEDLPKVFGEREARKYPIYAEPFEEYMVVYRTGRLELWQDPSLVSKCLGHGDTLKLHVATALKRGRAFVSLYSQIDSIFCLTFTKDEDSHHRLLPLRRSGSCIWIFDARTMTVAADWMWELWRELEGDIPESIDVHFPALSVRVRIPVPDELPLVEKSSLAGGASSYFEGGEGFKLVNREYVKAIVRKVVEAQTEWQQVCCSTEVNGLQFELAWRSGSILHWIKEDDTASGSRRDWAVLVGSILSASKRPAVLEYRPAFHYPTSVRSAKGEIFKEPPGIEGFLWRVKAVSGALTRLYVTTHDGLIFVNRPSKSYPPDRHLATVIEGVAARIDGSSRFATSAGNDQFEQDRRRRRDAIRGRKRSQAREESLADLRGQVMATLTTIVSTEEEIDAQIETYRSFEKRRRFEQINNCDGYVDIRDILLIKSLAPNGVIHQPSADDRGGSNTIPLNGQGYANGKMDSGSIVEEVEEDIGGEEGLAIAKDRNAMKMARQFELTMSNGKTIKFEAYSRSVAEEWIHRMASLTQYWKRREKVDALELMMGSGLDPAMTGQYVHGKRHEADILRANQPLDGPEISFILSNMWHWCVYQSCRGILRSGRLFQKKKAFSGFHSRYYILIAGRLLHFKLLTSTSTARARQNNGIFHKRQETVVHLRDAYVYSGHLTEDMLVNGRSEGAGAISAFSRGSSGAANSTSRHVLPRVYKDGLLSVDDDEDCTFIVRYRPQRVNQAADPAVATSFEVDNNDSDEDEDGVGAAVSSNEEKIPSTRPASSTSAPKLGDPTYNHLVLRARSKLERDLWVRAINIECERLSREDRNREEKIRNQGQTPWKVPYHHTSFT